MKPSKFIAHQERRLERPLSEHELGAIEQARVGCTGGKRDAVKAMWIALRAVSQPALGPGPARGSK